tara:strand:- start:610 stop:1485 length:876 start_codon:yes stop_codon:yes gene_type:complete
MYSIIAKHRILSLHILVLILGLTGVLGKLITLEAIHLVWWRMLIAFVGLAIFLAVKKELFKIKKRDFLNILGIGVIVTLHWLCFFQSIKVSNVSIAVVCLATSSLFAALIEPLFFKRKISLHEIIMGIIVIIALAYILGTDKTFLSGYIYGILAAFLGTLFTLFNAKYIKKIGAAKITMIEMLAGVLIISSIFIINQDFSVFNTKIGTNDLIYLIILGIICTAMVFVWMTEIVRYITPYSLIMAINLEPIYSILFALIIFGDSELMNTSFYIGSSVIILVIFLESYIKNKY